MLESTVLEIINFWLYKCSIITKLLNFINRVITGFKLKGSWKMKKKLCKKEV